MNAIAAVDASFFGLPLDPVVAGYVWSDRHRFWIYPIMAAAGSALGSLILFLLPGPSQAEKRGYHF